MRSIKFKEFRAADVSTAHLCIADMKAACDKGSPSHLAQHDQGYGNWFYVEQGDKEVDHWLEELSSAFSPAFIDLMSCIQLEGFDYVNFDAGGSIVEGFPQFTGEISDGGSNWNYPVTCFDAFNTVEKLSRKVVVALGHHGEAFDNPETTTFEVNSMDDVPAWATHLVAVETERN